MNHKSYCKAYYLKNREAILEKRRAYGAKNRDRCREYARARYYSHYRDLHKTEAAKAQHRVYWLKSRHGITVNQYEELLQKQNNKCAICGSEHKKSKGKSGTLHVDHCHSNGTIRGLLCYTCNIGVGYFQNRVDLLLKAVDYLKR